MEPNRINDWLRAWAQKQALLNLVGGVGTLLAGIGILIATWALVYAVCLFALGPWLGYRHWAHSVAGWVFIPALFWGNARTSREYLSDYSVTVGTTSETVVSFYLPGVGMGSTINPLAPNTMHSGVKIITDCLYAGPRIVMAAFAVFRKSGRLRQLDVEGCGAVLTVLLLAGRKTSFQEIVQQIEWLNPPQVFSQLGDIEGVIFLRAEPAGLTLSQELRETLRTTAC
ncbi:MAG TPA: hypothetical protein VNZ22_06900 [Bacillota bacterium]|nr:hypothetical protein [Bacillota bacterium]